jgi:hypothetical protein
MAPTWLTKSLFEELNGFNGNDKTQVEMMFFYCRKHMQASQTSS